MFSRFDACPCGGVDRALDFARPTSFDGFIQVIEHIKVWTTKNGLSHLVTDDFEYDIIFWFRYMVSTAVHDLCKKCAYNITTNTIYGKMLHIRNLRIDLVPITTDSHQFEGNFVCAYIFDMIQASGRFTVHANYKNILFLLQFNAIIFSAHSAPLFGTGICHKMLFKIRLHVRHKWIFRIIQPRHRVLQKLFGIHAVDCCRNRMTLLTMKRLAAPTIKLIVKAHIYWRWTMYFPFQFYYLFIFASLSAPISYKHAFLFELTRPYKIIDHRHIRILLWKIASTLNRHREMSIYTAALIKFNFYVFITILDLVPLMSCIPPGNLFHDCIICMYNSE